MGDCTSPGNPDGSTTEGRLIVFGIDEQTENTIKQQGGRLDYGFSHLAIKIQSSVQKATSDSSQQQRHQKQQAQHQHQPQQQWQQQAATNHFGWVGMYVDENSISPSIFITLILLGSK